MFFGYFCLMKFSRFYKHVVFVMRTLISIFLCLNFSNCINHKSIVILDQGEYPSTSKPAPVLICQKGDLLDVKVYSINRDIVEPFNGFLGTAAGENRGVATGYLIDEQNCISLPLVGRVNVSGLSIEEVEKLIEEKLVEFVKDPTVSVKIVNFEITVLGEEKKPGRILVSNSRASIIDLLGMAGDITPMSKRNDVLVVREVNGKRVEYHLDLTQKTLFENEGFYLKQNDIVYVPPYKPRRQASSGLFAVRNAVILTMTSLLGSWLISILSK